MQDEAIFIKFSPEIADLLGRSDTDIQAAVERSLAESGVRATTEVKRKDPTSTAEDKEVFLTILAASVAVSLVGSAIAFRSIDAAPQGRSAEDLLAKPSARRLMGRANRSATAREILCTKPSRHQAKHLPARLRRRISRPGRCSSFLSRAVVKRINSRIALPAFCNVRPRSVALHPRPCELHVTIGASSLLYARYRYGWSRLMPKHLPRRQMPLVAPSE